MAVHDHSGLAKHALMRVRQAGLLGADHCYFSQRTAPDAFLAATLPSSPRKLLGCTLWELAAVGPQQPRHVHSLNKCALMNVQQVMLLGAATSQTVTPQMLSWLPPSPAVYASFSGRAPGRAAGCRLLQLPTKTCPRCFPGCYPPRQSMQASWAYPVGACSCRCPVALAGAQTWSEGHATGEAAGCRLLPLSTQ